MTFTDSIGGKLQGRRQFIHGARSLPERGGTTTRQKLSDKCVESRRNWGREGMTNMVNRRNLLIGGSGAYLAANLPAFAQAAPKARRVCRECSPSEWWPGGLDHDDT